jgi:hypothetical protein
MAIDTKAVENVHFPGVVTHGQLNPLQTYVLKDLYKMSEEGVKPKNMSFCIGGRNWVPGGNPQITLNDSVGVQHGILVTAADYAAKHGMYNPCKLPEEDYTNCHLVVVDPDKTMKELGAMRVTEGALEEQGLIISGGLGNSIGMKAQFPGEQWSPQEDTMDKMYGAAIIPHRSHMYFDYPGAVLDQGLDPAKYMWQEMIQGKGANGPWTWELKRVDANGKTRGVGYSDPIKPKVSSGSVSDVLYIGAGLDINPLNPLVPAYLVVGGRGASTLPGNRAFDRNPELYETPGGEDLIKAIDRASNIVNTGDFGGFEMAIPTTLNVNEGVCVEIEKPVEVIYTPSKERLYDIYTKKLSE